MNLAFRKLEKDSPTLLDIKEPSHVWIHANSSLTQLRTFHTQQPGYYPILKLTPNNAGYFESLPRESNETIHSYPHTVSPYFLQRIQPYFIKTAQTSGPYPAQRVNTKNE